MTRHPDPLFNLADALSEDIVAAPADDLLHEAESDPGGRAGLIKSFDRIAARAVAQSRRRRIVERLRGMLQVLPVPIGLTSAMVGVASVCVVGIVGGMYFHQAESYRQVAAVPPPVLADRMPAKTSEPSVGTPMSYAERGATRLDPDSGSDRIARSDNAATPTTPAAVPAAPLVLPPLPPAPTAAPPVATQAPPPAPPVAAGAAVEPKPVRTVEIQ